MPGKIFRDEWTKPRKIDVLSLTGKTQEVVEKTIRYMMYECPMAWKNVSIDVASQVANLSFKTNDRKESSNLIRVFNNVARMEWETVEETAEGLLIQRLPADCQRNAWLIRYNCQDDSRNFPGQFDLVNVVKIDIEKIAAHVNAKDWFIKVLTHIRGYHDATDSWVVLCENCLSAEFEAEDDEGLGLKYPCENILENLTKENSLVVDNQSMNEPGIYFRNGTREFMIRCLDRLPRWLTDGIDGYHSQAQQQQDPFDRYQEEPQQQSQESPQLQQERYDYQKSQQQQFDNGYEQLFQIFGGDNFETDFLCDCNDESQQQDPHNSYPEQQQERYDHHQQQQSQESQQQQELQQRHSDHHPEPLPQSDNDDEQLFGSHFGEDDFENNYQLVSPISLDSSLASSLEGFEGDFVDLMLNPECNNDAFSDQSLHSSISLSANDSHTHHNEEAQNMVSQSVESCDRKRKRSSDGLGSSTANDSQTHHNEEAQNMVTQSVESCDHKRKRPCNRDVYVVEPLQLNFVISSQ